MSWIVRLETQDEPGTDFELGPFEHRLVAKWCAAYLTARYDRDPDFTVVLPANEGEFNGMGFPLEVGSPDNPLVISHMDGFYLDEKPEETP